MDLGQTLKFGVSTDLSIILMGTAGYSLTRIGESYG